jgi:hypothetical protein
MALRVLYFLAAPMTLAVVLIGASGVDDEFSREIGQPPQVVAQALQAVDVVSQPHTQAKLSAANRARPPRIVVQREPDGMSWFVMSGEQSLLRMKAELTPSAGGASTHVSTRVEQGQIDEAPNVPTLFSSPSRMAPLFAVAVERALGDYIPSSERSLYSVQERPWGYVEPSEAASGSRAPAESEPGVNFEPGRPMVKVSGR